MEEKSSDNKLVDFILRGGNLFFEDGQALIEGAKISEIKDAVKNSEARKALEAFMNKSFHPRFREKVRKALTKN